LSKPSTQKALFLEGNVPPGGTCLSSFVAITSGSHILVGKMARPDIWVERFMTGPKYAPVYANSGKYILPARHLAWYESPMEAAESIIRDQLLLKVPRSKISLIEVQSHVSGDVQNKDEPPHWDICFVYRVELPLGQAKRLKSIEWFEDLGFKPRSSLAADDFTRGHGDVLEQAGLIKKSKQRPK
jgi:ADP-ribose pyrophosphatase YjhB (NUDIX family)